MIAQVVVDVQSSWLDTLFDYIVPDGLDVKVGVRVAVPFGNRRVVGFVLSISDTSSYPVEKLKCIDKVIDSQPILSEKMIRLCFFMKKTFYLRLIDVISLILPTFIRSGEVREKSINMVRLNVDTLPDLGRAKKQMEIMQYLMEVGEAKSSDISSKFSASALKALIDKGYVTSFQKNEYRQPKIDFNVDKKNIVLNAEQQKAVDAITHSRYQTFLLFGVTGSGKTEVYISAIKDALARGKTAIMLVPEISLTPQMSARFRNAFGDTVAILHSMLSRGERYDEWNRLKNGEARIAIGARSAIFAPLDNLGLIVIDEEHDSSYFSESNPRFHTHEVARYLAFLHDCPVILGSATPSVASSYAVKTGEYRQIKLNSRFNSQNLPKVQIVDMLSEIRMGNTGIFSSKFLDEMQSCLDSGKQAMVFINRRGFSSFVMCKKCGFVPKCEDCDVSLVYHKEDGMLKCHYCSRRYKSLTTCPKCGSPSIRFGAVGTERVVEELKSRFHVPIFRLDNDTTTSKDAYVKILEQFNHTSPSILVGTQMIAKGHDFADVTFVGIVDADVSLHFSDYRAIERTFQLITQVSGRAGRSDSEGSVVLQTYYPKHFAYRCATNYDYDSFLKRELSLRSMTHFPPFVEIIRVLITSEVDDKAQASTQAILQDIKKLANTYSSDFVYLAGMKCPKKRLMGHYRYQIMIRINEKNKDVIVPRIYEICDKNKDNKVSVFVELDPQNLS